MSYPSAVQNAERWMACAIGALEDACNGAQLSERELLCITGLIDLVAQFNEVIQSADGQYLVEESERLRRIEDAKFVAFYEAEKAKHAQELAQKGTQHG